jgi:monovalent cation/hydrogen antiporter
VPDVAAILGLLVAVALLALLARRLGVPYPILMVLGGLAIALVPGLPRVTLAPDIVFLVFLPPLVYSGGWFTSLRDLKANLRPIGLLAVGLVLFTIVCIAAVAHLLVPSMPWAVAFALGAIVAPTDSFAASAIFRRLGAPRRISVILEGESLLNDATGLTAYTFATAAVVTGAFSFGLAGAQFLLSAVGGLVVGFVLAWALAEVQTRIDDAPIEITLSFLVPYGIYLAAQQLHVSGVLAVAVAGLYAGRRSPEMLSAISRVQGFAVWEVALFLLNGLAFILIGLQLPAIRDGLSGRQAGELLAVAAGIALAVIAVRFLWVFPATYLPRLLSRRLRRRDPYPGWRNVIIIAWTGMRGVVSLAAALALPLTVAGGRPFPQRDTVLLVTFAVIVVTLVLQGLSLPGLMRLLGVADDGSAMGEELEARTRTIEAALARLEELTVEEWTRDEGIAMMRVYYARRRKKVDTRFGRLDHEHGENGHRHEPGEDHVEAHRAHVESGRRLRMELLAAERSALVRLRNAGTIGDEVLQRVQHDLDLEELQLAQA